MQAIGYSFVPRLSRDEAGNAAVEFAMIAPLVIALFMASVEFSDAFLANRRVTLMASTVADLVAQAETITDDDVADIFAATTSVLVPFEPANVEIVVSSLVDPGDGGDPEIEWSEALHTSPLNEGDTMNDVPEEMVTPFGSVIVADVRYRYTSGMSSYIVGEFLLEKRFHSRPRRVLRVERE